MGKQGGHPVLEVEVEVEVVIESFRLIECIVMMCGVGLGVTCPGRLGWVSVILLCFCGSSVEGRDAGNRVQSERSHIVTLVTFEVHSVVLCAVC